MIILGIDPGTTRIGFGLIKKEKFGLKLLNSGLLKVKSKNRANRLLEIERSLQSLLKNSRPDLMALEKIYFSKNKKTGLDIAEARGVLILNACKAKLPLVEFSPSQIKNAVTGYGQADKKAVAKMCARILKIELLRAPDDVSDALAVAITASHYSQELLRSF